jgi:hypothetical protein
VAIQKDKPPTLYEDILAVQKIGLARIILEKILRECLREESAMRQDDTPEGERLGSPDVVGVSFTVGELILRLSQLNPALPVVSGWNNNAGIAIHQHNSINASMDFISFNHRT